MDNHWFSIYYSPIFCSRLFIDYRHLCATYLFSAAHALATSSCEVSADSFAFTHTSVQADVVQLVYTPLKTQIRRHKELKHDPKPLKTFQTLARNCLTSFTSISEWPHVRSVTVNPADTGEYTIFPLWEWADLTVCVKDYECQLEPEITAAQINQRVNPISLSALRPIYGHRTVIDEIWHYHKQSHCL